MSHTAPTLCICQRPTGGAFLCERCATTLAYSLPLLPAYYGGLDTVATKRTRFGVGAATKGSIGKSQPLPIDLRFTGATDVGSCLRSDTEKALRLWADRVRSEQPPLAGPVCEVCLHRSCHAVRLRRTAPGVTVRTRAAFLELHLRYITGRDYAPDMLLQLTDLEHRLARFIDRPADRWYAGKCSEPDEDGVRCEAELYATAERGAITCPSCGTRHDVAGRRDFLLREAKGYLVTATEAAGALMAWTDYDGSETKLVDRIRKWRDRDRLQVRGHVEVHGHDRDLYRLGDIQELLVDDARNRNTRRIGVA